MTYVQRKTGADAIFGAFHKICQMITKYQVPLQLLIDAAAAAGVITGIEQSAANALLVDAVNLCQIWEKLAKFNSIQP